MKINPKKCKKMRVCFLRELPGVDFLTIADTPLEVVKSHKVLGTVINCSLKWNDHIAMITSKASKRLYIIRVLKRSGMSLEDLISICIALVRSVLEICCPVWHSNLTAHL